MKPKDTKTSKNKLKLFKIIAVSVPFLLLLLAELIFTILNWGSQPPLFVEDPAHPEYLMMNQKVSLRYFQNPKLATWGQYDVFQKLKSKKTIRIVVQGASTGVGFPYMQSIAYPKIIERWLQIAYPAYHFEVINTSLAATNSFTMLDFCKEIVEIDPDLILIYGGHNEYYGVLGAASSQKGVPTYFLNSLFLKLKNVRLIQVLRKGFYQLRSQPINEKSTLMANMVGDKQIPLNSKLFKKGEIQFQKNMKKILESYYANDIPVIVSTLVSNLANQPPFSSIKCNQNLSQFSCNTEMSCPESASAWYNLGSQSDSIECKKSSLLKAKENDLLRFRAPEAFNEWIRNIAPDKALVIDMDSIFSNYSPDGIIGSVLMTEHVHPNVAGYYLLANSMMAPIIKQLELTEDRTPISFDRVDYNPIDSIYGTLLVQRLLSNWPFVEDHALSDPLKDFSSDDPIIQFVMYLYRGQLTWVEVVNKCYNYYMSNGYYNLAQRVASNLAQEFPLIDNPKSMAIKAAQLNQDYVSLSKMFLSWGKSFYLSDQVRAMSFDTFIKGNFMHNAIEVAEAETREKISKEMNALLDTLTRSLSQADQ